MKTKRLTVLAMLIAMNVVLSIVTPIKLENFKFTFEAFPILVAGFLMGPVDGFIVGFLGSFLYQLLFSGYGLTITTILWILPHALSGLIVGLLAKLFNNRNILTTIIITIISAIVVTTFNTLALYVDSKMYGYYSSTLVFGSILTKVVAGIILAIVFSLIIPKLLPRIEKLMK